MKDLKISIITCTYNSERYLQQTIDSIKSQTYPNYEHIFVDAFSTDKTIEIIKKYQTEQPDKVSIYQQKPAGISNAMNYGVEKANGEIICHLHSDDLFFDKNTLDYVSKSFIKNKINWCYGNLVLIDENDKEYNREQPPIFNYSTLRNRNFIPHPSTFIKRDFFLSLGGFYGYKYAMDYDLWLRASQESEPLKVNYYLAKFRRHSNGLSTKQYISTLEEDWLIRCGVTSNKFLRILDWIRLQYKIGKYKLAKLLGRS